MFLLAKEYLNNPFNCDNLPTLHAYEYGILFTDLSFINVKISQTRILVCMSIAKNLLRSLATNI